MKNPSLLSRERAEEIFERHKKALAHDGSLSPVIFVSLQEIYSNKPTVIPVVVVPPNDPLGKEIYYGALCAELRKKGTILEALIVFEGWAVVSSVRPTKSISSHPDRREMLGMMGRNKEKSRVTRVQQFFSHNERGAIKWEEMPVALFDVPAAPSIVSPMVEVLDYLFPPVN